ncbi:Pimeloyl-ACP methyl ester carboxylesterase [Marivirga sericea]|uniref:Pimeloyl-ACP methyl ester carboxylesterase n=1 Tax=Marivirga sericea TaxID=1028 RepID=A0A1X7LG37_9BACT|nr:alpha/beta hydrolase [Marivirga sericea]SMG52474.1 Pimeloyl-ACP methyl ester carboxylesterase [Marivirga sericea]
MKNKNYILALLFTAVSLLITSLCNAQIADSIKYENGFLHYHEYGSSNLPPIIILTGGPGNSYDQLEGLAESKSTKFRSILLEQRGTGKSIPIPFDSTTVNINAVTKDIKTLMDSLKLEKSIILGHSWGGMLAMNFASEYPTSVNHLILVAPGPHKDAENGFNVLFTNRRHTRSFEEEQRLNQLNELIANKEADSLEIIESRKLFRRAYIFANPIPDSVSQKINSEINSKTGKLLYNDIISNYDVSKSLKNYTGEIDVITGRQDVVGFFSYELKQDIEKAKIHWINESGHFPMYEQPSEFYKILYEILNVK